MNDMTITIPDEFVYNNTAALEAKLAGFKKAGIDQLQVVLDFDRTLTVGKSKNYYDSTSWGILRSHLPAEDTTRVDEIKRKYRALEEAGTLTAEEAVEWWTSSLDIMVEGRLDMTAVENDFMSKSTIRSGTRELFAVCEKYNVPTIIMSAGVREVIEIWCKAYDIHPTMILSTDLQLDDARRVIGWDPATLVHTLNKQEIGHPELSRIRQERSHTILVGDSIHDYTMAAGDDTVLRVRIVDPQPDNPSFQVNERPKTFELFDISIEHGSLAELAGVIQTIAR